jgi:NDP-sugar pyrophosphorylase family protein
MKAIILVGGQGTRMRPLTNRLPKNIVPLCGVPFLTYQIEYLKRAGIKEIVFSIGYRPQDIKKVYGDGRKDGVKIHYALETTPLGTAGAIKNCEKFVKGSPVVVLNGDILTALSLTQMIRFHRKHKNLVTLGLVHAEDPTMYGLVLLNHQNRVTQFLEKPTADKVVTDTINAGVYVFEPEVFNFIPDVVPCSVERVVFPDILKAKRSMGGFVSEGYWQDIGTPYKYLTTHWDVLRGAFPVYAKLRRTSKKVYLGKGVKIAKGAVVQGPAILEDGCVIAQGAKVLPYSVLGKKCKLGPGSSVSKSLLWDGVIVGADLHLEEVVLGRHCKVKKPLDKGSVLGDNNSL